ncbi:phage tail protein [Pedobacter nototheniae]|uniref:phage tail protein n=1 Tax=Pedobacter nototheniae TaxID=2488994 RepID=UPI00292ECFED|nr:tail fiber protein [Pedobacter nototheniae]
MDEYVGIIKIFGGNFAPRGWLLCNGQIVSLSQYQALFAIIGTTYGGNGLSTFGLPDLRGRVPIGTGQGVGLPLVNLGEIGGTPSVSLIVNNLPAHNHLVTGTVKQAVNADSANTDSPESTYLGPVSTGNLYNNQPSPNVFGGNLAVNLTTATTGAGTPVNNLQPYLGLSYIICFEGLFPTRN